MRVVVADCSVVYTGRGDTKLGRAVRALVVKSDGSVSVHNDRGTKPLNYMGKGCVQSVKVNADGVEVWCYDTRKESLQICMYQVFSDSSFLLESGADDVLERDGTELHLQVWLAEHPEVVGEGFTFSSREFATGAGPVDLFMMDEDGVPVAVEVKRTAMLGVVDQVSRYVEALRAAGYDDVYGLIVALDVRPKTRELAEKRGIRWVEVPSDWNASVVNVVEDELTHPPQH